MFQKTTRTELMRKDAIIRYNFSKVSFLVMFLLNFTRSKSEILKSLISEADTDQLDAESRNNQVRFLKSRLSTHVLVHCRKVANFKLLNFVTLHFVALRILNIVTLLTLTASYLVRICEFHNYQDALEMPIGNSQKSARY